MALKLQPGTRLVVATHNPGKVRELAEILENRFDLKTRVLTSLLFLIQRGLSTGITIYAPSIILSTIKAR